MKRGSRLTYIAAAILVATALLSTASPAVAQSAKPNILFIFADDLCYEMVHAFGNDEVQTPNLDRLARNGLAFSHAYNMGSWSGAVCVASRTMLNTGRFVWRARTVDNAKTLEAERQAGRFWSEYLKSADYETYFTGKWHVKVDAEKAFDYATHVRPGMPKDTKESYDRPHRGQPDPWKPWDPAQGGYWEGGKHWSEVVGDDGVGYLEQAAQRDAPFFMYLAFNAPHDPRQSPKEYVDMYPLKSVQVPVNFRREYPFMNDIGCGPKLRDARLAPFPRTRYAVKVHRQEYNAITTHMDAQVGRILDALEKSGKADNTYIFFSADHGLAVGHHGLIGKQNMYDHSVRVPLIVCGPGVAKNETNDARVYLQDIMATTLEVAGVEKPDHIQFKSLFPLIRGEQEQAYDAIYGGYLALQRMVTQGDFKMILYPKIAKTRLYNVKEDPDEMKDLAGDAQHKPLMKRLFARLLELQVETGDELDLKSVYSDLL